MYDKVVTSACVMLMLMCGPAVRADLGFSVPTGPVSAHVSVSTLVLSSMLYRVCSLRRFSSEPLMVMRTALRATAHWTEVTI